MAANVAKNADRTANPNDHDRKLESGCGSHWRSTFVLSPNTMMQIVVVIAVNKNKRFIKHVMDLFARCTHKYQQHTHLGPALSQLLPIGPRAQFYRFWCKLTGNLGSRNCSQVGPTPPKAGPAYPHPHPPKKTTHPQPHNTTSCDPTSILCILHLTKN